MCEPSQTCALLQGSLCAYSFRYDWFNLHRGEGKLRPQVPAHSAAEPTSDDQGPATEEGENPEAVDGQKQFFEYAGPLFAALISPSSSVIPVEGTRKLRAIARSGAAAGRT